jgi:flagellar hook-associated protein 3 FlgL
MRITGNRMIELGAAATAQGQTRVSEAGEQVTSGLRVAKSSDDPTAWVAAERAKVHRALERGAGAAVQAANDRLDETDAALATIGDIVSQVRALAIQGASATYNAEDRAEIGVQVRALRTAALGAANTRSADGEFLLGGTASSTAPFDEATGAYLGNAVARAVPTGEATQTFATITGAELTSAAGVDVFPLLDRIALALETNDPQTIQDSLDELETAVGQLSMSRTHTGGAMSVLRSTKEAHATLEQNFARKIAEHVEADTVASASELARASQALTAAQTVASHIVGLLDPR